MRKARTHSVPKAGTVEPGNTERGKVRGGDAGGGSPKDSYKGEEGGIKFTDVVVWYHV